MLVIIIAVGFYIENRPPRGIDYKSISKNKNILEKIEEFRNKLWEIKSYQLFSHDLIYKQYLNDLENEFAKEIKIKQQHSNFPKVLMVSATKRVEQVIQPNEGYLPINEFKVETYEDNRKIVKFNKKDGSNFSFYINEVVKYLSIYLLKRDIYISFSPLIKSVFEYFNNFNKYSQEKLFDDELLNLYEDFSQKLNSILYLKIDSFSNNDYELIRNLFKIAQFKFVYENNCKNKKIFKRTKNGIELVFSDVIHIPDYVCSNVLIMANRAANFFRSNKRLYFNEFFYSSGITSSSSCDFLTDSTVWKLHVDAKQFSEDPNFSSISLETLISFILMNSILNLDYKKYKGVEQIGIFNPYTNSACVTHNLKTKLNDKLFQEVKYEIVGLHWFNTMGFRIDTRSELIKTANYVVKHNQKGIFFFSKYNIN